MFQSLLFVSLEHPAFLIARYGMSSSRGQRRTRTVTDGSSEYIEYAVADSRQGVILQVGD